MIKNFLDKNFIFSIKKKIIVLLIFSFFMSSLHGIDIYAGEWVLSPEGMIMYLGDNGKYAQNEWRWIDKDYDSIAECYRFNEFGYLIASAYAPDGRFVNLSGQWEEDGEVKQVYFSSLKPVVRRVKTLNVENNYISTGNETRRINGTGKDLEKLAEERSKKRNGGKTVYKAPKIGTMSISDDGYIRHSSVLHKPKADGIRGQTIVTYTKEDTIATGTGSTPTHLQGKDMSKRVTASKNFTREVESAKIWGGEVWEKCMCLAGNESYLKVALEGDNYMRVEVAHQTHGTSTANTECYLELWIDGEFIDSYNSFVDGEPLVIEEWFDDGEGTFELHWIVESGSQGRKLYLRDGRLKKIKYDDD